MNKLFLLVIPILILSAFAGFSHPISTIHSQSMIPAANSTLNNTVNNTNITHPQITEHLVGYNQAYGLYVTAPTNQKVDFITSFYVNVSRSPGNSTVEVYDGASLIQSSVKSFSWDTRDYINVSANNATATITVKIFSSQLGSSQSFLYYLTFMTATTYIHYENQKTVKSNLPGVSITANTGTYLFGGIVGGAGLLAAITLRMASRKGWLLPKINKEKVKAEKKKKWSEWFVPKNTN